MLLLKKPEISHYFQFWSNFYTVVVGTFQFPYKSWSTLKTASTKNYNFSTGRNNKPFMAWFKRKSKSQFGRQNRWTTCLKYRFPFGPMPETREDRSLENFYTYPILTKHGCFAEQRSRFSRKTKMWPWNRHGNFSHKTFQHLVLRYSYRDKSPPPPKSHSKFYFKNS